MTDEEILGFGLNLPAAHYVVQWGGLSVLKLDKKIFGILSPGKRRMVVKLASAESGALLIEVGAAERFPYAKGTTWVNLCLDRLEDDDIQSRLTTSYRLVRRSLTKKLEASLPPFEAP